jgi:hypothetical protein
VSIGSAQAIFCRWLQKLNGFSTSGFHIALRVPDRILFVMLRYSEPRPLPEIRSPIAAAKPR